MSDGQSEPSNQNPSNSSGTRQVGTLRDAVSAQLTSRVIGNVLARRPTEGGTRGKMMFMPNKVVRRKVEDGVVEPGASNVEAVGQSTTQGEGRGRGDGRGRGRGRGGPQPPTEMVASGPFALGPTASTNRRPTRITTASAQPPGHGSGQPRGTGLTDTAAPTLSNTRKLQKRRVGLEAADKEQYSDDEGVEIVDIDDVNELDWMAPDSLVRVKEEEEEKAAKKRDKLKGKIKDDSNEVPIKFKVEPKGDYRNVDPSPSPRAASTVRASHPDEDADDKLLANALDLSESEEEEEMEDLVEDFLANGRGDEPLNTSQNKLYYFQFPHPFPTFEPVPKGGECATDVNMTNDLNSSSDKGKQKVTFADSLSDDESSQSKIKAEDEASKPSGGKIGQLEIYRSGLVKMRLGDGVITAATQPSFLQHAVYHDETKKRLIVLGEVNRRFIASPDIDILLEDMLVVEEKEGRRKMEETKDDGLIRMDD